MKKITLILGFIILTVLSYGQLLAPKGLTLTAPFKFGGTTITATGTELNYVHNVTSAIQTQFTGKINVSDSATMLAHYAKTISINSGLAGKVSTSTTVNGHALSGNISVTATDLSLNNVTNESKATMFTSPTFTGTPVIPTPFNLGATSVTTTAAQFNYLNTITSNVQTQLNALMDSIGVLRASLGGKQVTTPWVSHIRYVSTTGNDANDGKTTGTPWLTLPYAASQVSSGAVDTIYLERGKTWTLTSSLAIKKGGANGMPIVWDGYAWGTGAKAIIISGASRDANNSSMVNFITSGAHYITFQNITVDGNNKKTDGIVIGGHTGYSNNVQDSEHDIKIYGCTVQNCGDNSGIYIGLLCETRSNNIANITVQNCTFNGVDDVAICFYPGRSNNSATPAEESNILIKGNTVTNFGRRDASTADGIYITNKVTGYIIENNTVTTGASGHGSGIIIQVNEPNAGWFPTGGVVRYNSVTITESNDWALVITDGQAQTCDIYYNIFTQGVNTTDADGGCAVIRLATWTGASLKFYNNDFYSTSGITFLSEVAASIVTQKNNIFYNTGVDDTGNPTDYIYYGGTVTHSYNSYYRSANVNYTKVINSGYKQTNAQVTTYEATAVATNPTFVTAGSNFHLQASSPLKTTGVTIAGLPLFDFEGNAVSASTPSIGAYEYH